MPTFQLLKVQHGRLIHKSFESCECMTLQAEQIKQALEDYESSGVWNLERDARGNPTIVLGQDDHR